MTITVPIDRVDEIIDHLNFLTSIPESEYSPYWNININFTNKTCYVSPANVASSNADYLFLNILLSIDPSNWQ